MAMEKSLTIFSLNKAVALIRTLSNSLDYTHTLHLAPIVNYQQKIAQQIPNNFWLHFHNKKNTSSVLVVFVVASL